MALLLRMDCPCCRRFEITGDFFHDKETWNTYHKSGWINGKSDWQPREEIESFLVAMKKAWLVVHHNKS